MRLIKRLFLVVGLFVSLVPVLAISFVILSLVSPDAVVIGVVCMVLLGVWLLVRWRSGAAGSNPESGSMFNRSKEGLL